MGGRYFHDRERNKTMLIGDVIIGGIMAISLLCCIVCAMFFAPIR